MRELEEKLEKQRKALLKKHADELKKQISEKGEERQQTKKIVEIENQQLQ